MPANQTLPPIEDAAAMLLPGLRTVIPKTPDEKFAEDAEQLKALLSVFGTLRSKGVFYTETLIAIDLPYADPHA